MGGTASVSAPPRGLELDRSTPAVGSKFTAVADALQTGVPAAEETGEIAPSRVTGALAKFAPGGLIGYHAVNRDEDLVRQLLATQEDHLLGRVL